MVFQIATCPPARRQAHSVTQDPPSHHAPLAPDRFFDEAAQLHQIWIRRFDAQNPRRPRPAEVEAERLRLVRRLQLLQRLQGENLVPEAVAPRLEALATSPRDARLVEGDSPFLEALLTTWRAAQLPQAAALVAGAHPPKPGAVVQFRW